MHTHVSVLQMKECLLPALARLVRKQLLVLYSSSFELHRAHKVIGHPSEPGRKLSFAHNIELEQHLLCRLRRQLDIKIAFPGQRTVAASKALLSAIEPFCRCWQMQRMHRIARFSCC